MLVYTTQGIIIPIVFNIRNNKLLDLIILGTIIHNMNFYSCDKYDSIQKRIVFWWGKNIFCIFAWWKFWGRLA